MMHEINLGLRGDIKSTDWHCSTCGHKWTGYPYARWTGCPRCESESVKGRDAG